MGEAPIYVFLQPHFSYCSGFKSAAGYSPAGRMTVIIVPARVQQSDGKMIVVWRCNLGDSCVNEYCTYSREGRKNEQAG